ncbi:permease, partial [Pseudomonas sp. 2995-1]
SYYILFSMGVMSLCMGYLSPQFRQQDERSKIIRQKGIFYSYFAIIFYFIIFTTLLQFDIIYLTAVDVLYILMSLIIATVFVSFVIVSKFH